MEPDERVDDRGPNRPGRLSLLILAMAVIAISSSAVLVRWADASPVALAFWRTAGGALIMAGPALRDRTRPKPMPWRLLLLAGAALGLHFASWLASLELTTIAASVTLVTASPLLIGGYLLVSGRRPGRHSWLAIAVALLGTVIIAGTDARGDTTALLGDALALVGAAMMAIYLLIGDRLRSEMTTASYTASAYAAAALVLAIVATVFRVSLFGFDTKTWLVVAAMIVGPQMAGHTALNMLLKEMGSVSVSMALLAEPVGATLLAWLLLAELPPAAAVIGGPLILVGLAIQLRGDAAQPQSTSRSAANEP